nr:hypothetical protein [uncultured Mucilaginibacter sp.]
MIEKTLKTIGGQINIKIPSLLNELTLGKLMALQDKSDLSDLDAISILSGVAIDELQNIKNAEDLHVFGEAVLSLSTQISYLYNSDEIPKKVTFYHGKSPVEIKVINNLSVEPAGAFLASRDVIATEINEHIKAHGEEDWQQRFNPSLKACRQILAHYFYCRVTGERYNEYKIEAFYDVIKQLRVTEALPIAKYFFMSYPNSSKEKTSFWRRLLPFWKKRQAYKVLSVSDISTPLTHLPAAM